MAASTVRSLVLWFPDWPVTALIRDPSAKADSAGPIAVLEAGVVSACSVRARAEGVRRGQRRRDAQARCPALQVVAADPARDHRAFEPVVSLIEERAPGVQIVRPGLCALRVRGPARYYGGEAEAARVLLDALRAIGFDDVRAGVADGPFAAEQAARSATHGDDPIRIVAAGEAADFLAPQPVAALDQIAAASGVEPLSDLLARLGVHTLGEFAALGEDRVRERFGDRGARLHALAAGRDPRAVEPRVPPPELERAIAFEPPLEVVEQVAFAIRVTAEDFLAGLVGEGLVCTELRVRLEAQDAPGSERVWLHPTAFDSAGVVDRVRWQLEAQEPVAEGMRGGVTLVRLIPEAVDAASHHQPAIFGGSAEERVHHTLSRVQAMLGHRSVLVPAIGGGRWLAERQVLVPWGDRVVVAKERARPWPGSLTAPLPAMVFPVPEPVEVTDAAGHPVGIDERGNLSAPPAVLAVQRRRMPVEAWAGPWPVSEREWDAARRRRAHRFQLVDADQTAWLVVHEAGVWTAEARYD